MPQRDDRGDLDGLKQAIIVITLDDAESPHHFCIAAAIADAPAGHVVALAHGCEFDTYVLRAGRGQKTWRLIAIECYVGVSKIADDHETVTAGQLDDFNIELRIDSFARRVMRIVNYEQLGTRRHMLACERDVREKLFAVADFMRDDITGCHHDGVHVSRKKWGGNDCGLTGAHRGQAHVAETFL